MKRSQTISISPEGATFSTYDLIFIPLNPNFQPDDEQFKLSMALLESDFPDSEITGDCFEHTEFIDSGQNFENIHCPYCKTEIELESWQCWMSESYESSKFENLSIITTCCSKPSQLSDLNYNGMDGFSSFAIRVNNAESNESNELEIIEDLSAINETPFRCFFRVG